VKTFEAFTWQHLLPVVFFLTAGILLVRLVKHSPEKRKTEIGVFIACAVLAFMIGGSAIKIASGTYDYKGDLPLYLCRIVAWMLPVVVWKRNRFWLGVFYFWVLAGTLQGIITPDLAEGFPNYFYFRYWFLHAGLVVAILYAIIVFKVQIKWKDFGYAILLAQVYVVLVHLVNIVLGSNYSYTMQKPPGPSVLGMMGPWPVYILAGEGLMVILFLLLMLPWVRIWKVQ